MKLKITTFLSVTLAGLLQFMPLLRSALPEMQSMGAPTGAWIMKWAVGGVAVFGYHAISSASSIAVSPPTALLGVPYSGTITYSGGHAGSVASMSMSNVCLGSFTLAPGLTVTYSGGHTASLTGTPTGALATVPFALKMWDLGGCTGSLTDTRSTSLIIQNSGGGAAAPLMLVAPQSVLAQVGSDVILSGGASGNPVPQYFWKQGATVIPGATNNTLLIPSVQLTNSGVYTLVASNSQGQTPSACTLTIAVTPGSNTLAFQYTNYIVAGTALTMYSLITNVPSATNIYDWTYNVTTDLGASSNLIFSPAATIPLNSGTYAVNFNSKVGSTTVVNNEQFVSWWVFGYLPNITSPPSGQSVGAGSNATFHATVAGTTPTLLWFLNQTNLVSTQTLNFNPPNATTTTNVSLVISNVSSANAGNYTVTVTNFWGTSNSTSALLTVIPALSVSSPQSQTNYAGKSVSISVTATGAPPISYQWQKGGVNLSNGGAISGIATNTLSIAPAATNHSGNYQVVVTNSSGSVTSSVAILSIVPVPRLAPSLLSGNPALNATGGVANSSYVVQRSTNLANTSGWVPVKTNVVPSNGSISFTDTNPPPSAQRFYRVQFP